MDKLVQLLLSETVKGEPSPLAPVEPPGLETLLQTYFAEQQSPRQGLKVRQGRRNWSNVKCFSCGKTGHSATRCPTLDVTFPFILPGWKAEKTSTGYLMISPKMAPGGKRRLIRGEGFASRISKNARPYDPGGGGGGAIRYPVPQNATKMNLRKPPMDMNTNRNVKLTQVSSQVAERASSDGATNKQCQPAYRQSTKTTVIETYTSFADKPKPIQSQGTAVAAEEAGTDGTTNVQCRSIAYDNMKTAVMKLPKDFVKITKPTLSRVSPVVAKMAHTDSNRVTQYQSDDQNSMKTTNMQMHMDYLEIPEPVLPWGFLELAEEDRNVSVESGQSCYTEEVQSQGAGLARPVFVTVMEYSSSELKEGAKIAPGISTEMIPTTFSAGRRSPVDQLGLVGPQDKTEQSVLPAPDTKEVGTDPAGPVGPDVTVDRVQPVAEGPVGQCITRRPVGPDRMFSTCDSDQPMADGPVGRFITRSPVGPDGMFSTCDSDRPVAETPVGQSFILGPVGPRRMFSQCKPNQPVAVGPVGQSFTTSPVGSTMIPDPAEETGSPIQTDEDIQYNDVTICRKEHSLVNSATDGGNSDIGVLTDCSENEEES